MAREVLGYTSAGPVANIATLAGGRAEVIELKAQEGAPVVGYRLTEKGKRIVGKGKEG
jgi:Trk K+ transport system NAD-binding subunit